MAVLFDFLIRVTLWGDYAEKEEDYSTRPGVNLRGVTAKEFFGDVSLSLEREGRMQVVRYPRRSEVVYDACSVVKENGQQCGEKDCCEHLGAATVPRYRVRIQLVDGPELADSMWADVWGDVAEGLFKMSAPEMNNLTGVEVEDAKAGTMGKVYELTLRAQYREAKRKSGAALQFV